MALDELVLAATRGFPGGWVLPDGELAVSRNPAANRAHEDVYVAIRDAFDAMRRRLEDYAAQRRGQVKTHEPPPGTPGAV